MMSSSLTSIACKTREHTDGWGLLALRLFVAQELYMRNRATESVDPEWFVRAIGI